MLIWMKSAVVTMLHRSSNSNCFHFDLASLDWITIKEAMFYHGLWNNSYLFAYFKHLSTGGALVGGEVTIGALRVGAIPAPLAVRTARPTPINVVVLRDPLVLNLLYHPYMMTA